MSYAESPETNPYAAPKSAVAGSDFGSPTRFAGYAGFWLRFVAAIIDSIVTALISMVGGFILGIFLGVIAAATGNQNLVQSIAGPVGFIFGIVVGIAYFAGMESSSKQATLGKMSLGIKVTDLNGRRISFGRAVGRYLGKIISGLILAIGYIMAGFTEKKQALHDMMAGTLVVKTG